jgi:universal stress protein A
MLPIHTIVYPTDFSEPSGFAFRMACSLARDYNARLFVLHVIPPALVYGEGLIAPITDGHQDELREQMNKMDPRDPRLIIERRLVEGDPATEILRVARELPCDLIVMGTHGRTGLGRLLMGSVAEQIVRKAPCPVLTVKAPLAPEVAETPVASEEPAHLA